jgi:hypothetical protein
MARSLVSTRQRKLTKLTEISAEVTFLCDTFKDKRTITSGRSNALEKINDGGLQLCFIAPGKELRETLPTLEGDLLYFTVFA